jgi:hypothetical protein
MKGLRWDALEGDWMVSVHLSLDERVKVRCLGVRLDGLCPPQFG